MRNKSFNFILLLTLQVQGNMTKVLKTLALENLTCSIHFVFLFKNRIPGSNSVWKSIKNPFFWGNLMKIASKKIILNLSADPKYDFINLINSALSAYSFSAMNQPRKKFILYTLYLFASIKGRINFLQPGRFGKYCEQYFRIGFQQKFDFLLFNTQLIQGASFLR